MGHDDDCKPHASGGATRRKMSSCDADLRMFVIQELGIDRFIQALAKDAVETERLLDGMCTLIRTGHYPHGKPEESTPDT